MLWRSTVKQWLILCCYSYFLDFTHNHTFNTFSHTFWVLILCSKQKILCSRLLKSCAVKPQHLLSDIKKDRLYTCPSLTIPYFQVASFLPLWYLLKHACINPLWYEKHYAPKFLVAFLASFLLLYIL